jgi:hypothetical protein
MCPGSPPKVLSYAESIPPRLYPVPKEPISCSSATPFISPCCGGKLTGVEDTRSVFRVGLYALEEVPCAWQAHSTQSVEADNYQVTLSALAGGVVVPQPPLPWTLPPSLPPPPNTHSKPMPKLDSARNLISPEQAYRRRSQQHTWQLQKGNPATLFPSQTPSGDPFFHSAMTLGGYTCVQKD